MQNEINVFESDSDEEMIWQLNRVRKEKVFRPRVNYKEELDEQEFIRRFRINKQTFQSLLNKIHPVITSMTNKNHAISSNIKLLLTLRFYATGSMLLTVGDFTGVSESSACVIVQTVTRAIASLSVNHIKMPTTANDITDAQIEFYRIAMFLKVIGVLDCTHIEIESPGGRDAEYYRNRKGWFSWNVQVLCDANLKINNIVSRWSGSTHDQTIFNNSVLKQRLEEGIFNDSIILGDSGYMLAPPEHPPIDDDEDEEIDIDGRRVRNHFVNTLRIIPN